MSLSYVSLNVGISMFAEFSESSSMACYSTLESFHSYPLRIEIKLNANLVSFASLF